MANNKATATLFEQEMSSFLQLATGELKLSMKDASGSVQMLTKTFMEMVREVHEIKALAEEMKGGRGDNLEQIIKTCDDYLDKVQDGTVGFQFYDKLTQRLSHTSESIKRLHSLMQEPQKLNESTEWESFRKDLQRGYNTEADRRFFEAMMEGSSIKEAIKIAMGNNSKENKAGDVELF
jgi:hypothetical protein